MAAPPPDSEFFGQFVQVCKEMFSHAKNIRQMLSNQEYDAMFEEAKKTAESTLGNFDLPIITKLQDFMFLVSSSETLKKISEFDTILDLSKQVRTRVLAFLQCARSCASRPFDYAASQEFTNSR